MKGTRSFSGRPNQVKMWFVLEKNYSTNKENNFYQTESNFNELKSRPTEPLTLPACITTLD